MKEGLSFSSCVAKSEPKYFSRVRGAPGELLLFLDYSSISIHILALSSVNSFYLPFSQFSHFYLSLSVIVAVLAGLCINFAL